MDFKDALKNAGVNVADKPVKIDSKNANIKIKLDRTENILEKLKEATVELDNTSNKKEFELVQAKLILYYQRFCDAVKDLLDVVTTKEKVKGISDNRGLGELIRKTFDILDVEDMQQDTIKRLTSRNDIVHDYMNVEYYDEAITTQVMNDIEVYIQYFGKIKSYFS